MKKRETEIREDFKRAIKCGLGEAYILQRDNPDIDFSDLIINGVTQDLNYDVQSEGVRVFYFSSLIDTTKKRAEIEEQLLQALLYETKDSHAIDRLYQLVELYALQGNEGARESIHYKYNTFLCKGCEYLGEDAIVKLDGLQGLLTVAKRRGESLLNDKSDFDSPRLVETFQKDNPSIVVYKELEQAADKNEFVKAYLEAIVETKINLERIEGVKEAWDYERVKNRLDLGAPIAPKYIDELNSSAIEKLANDTLLVKDELILTRYIQIFGDIEFPLGYEYLFTLVQRAEGFLLEVACKALGRFKNEEVRNFALDMLKNLNVSEEYLRLLESNYEEGDEKLLIGIANSVTDDDAIHRIGISYIDIYENNRTKSCKVPLEIIYRKMNCGKHRFDLVKVLYDNNVLSLEILEELKYDSSEELRTFYQEVQVI